jgi:hypothetical protein
VHHRPLRRQHQRVAIGRRARGLGGADHAACARLVVDHDRLAERLGQFLAKGARGDVGAGAGGERHDQADWSVRPVRLGPDKGCGRCGNEGHRPEQRSSRRNHDDASSDSDQMGTCSSTIFIARS